MTVKMQLELIRLGAAQALVRRQINCQPTGWLKSGHLRGHHDSHDTAGRRQVSTSSNHKPADTHQATSTHAVHVPPRFLMRERERDAPICCGSPFAQ